MIALSACLRLMTHFNVAAALALVAWLVTSVPIDPPPADAAQRSAGERP